MKKLELPPCRTARSCHGTAYSDRVSSKLAAPDTHLCRCLAYRLHRHAGHDDRGAYLAHRFRRIQGANHGHGFRNWALGVRDPEFVSDERGTAAQKVLLAKAAWAVLSFRKLPVGDPEAASAEKQAGVTLPNGPLFRFHVFRWGKEVDEANTTGNQGKPAYVVRVEMLEEAIAYASGSVVLLRRDGGTWTKDTSMPT